MEKTSSLTHELFISKGGALTLIKLHLLLIFSSTYICPLQTSTTIFCPAPNTQSGNWTMGGIWLDRETAKKDNITIIRDEQETTLTMPCKHQYNGTTVEYIVAGMTICKSRLKVVGDDTPSDTTLPCPSRSTSAVTTTPYPTSGIASASFPKVMYTATSQVMYTVLLVLLAIVLMAIIVVLLCLVLLSAVPARRSTPRLGRNFPQSTRTTTPHQTSSWW